MKLFGWLRKGDRNKLNASEIVGNVADGKIGTLTQIYNAAQPLAPPIIKWADLPARGAPLEYSQLLSWKCRLAWDLIGRDAEKTKLKEWAGTGTEPGVKIRFLTGPGGAGKTRLAAEVATALAEEGWHAGFPASRRPDLPFSEKALFLLIDYPEAWRKEVGELLQRAAGLNPKAPIRILFLSRRPLSDWEEEILQCGANTLCDAQELRIGQLAPELATALFKAAAERFATYRGSSAPLPDDRTIANWLAANEDAYSLPLLITACAIHSIDFNDAALSRPGVEVISELMERERTQLDRVGQNAGWGNHAASRLIGLAALRDGLDEAALRRLARRDLEITRLDPTSIVGAVKDRLGMQENKRLVAPGPDLVAAELLRQVLEEGGDRSSEWVWGTLAEPDSIQIELLDRRVYDTITLHGTPERLLVQTLIDAVSGHPQRAAAWRKILDAEQASFRLGEVGITIAQTLLADRDLSGEQRAALLNNLSLRLSDAGDRPAALAASREALEIRRRLAEENPARFNPDLARSLTNLSNHLSDAGDQPAALAAIRKAVDLYRPLAKENPARFNPDLALILNNLSNRLSDAGDQPAALAAIRDAVEIRRRLAEDNPARFNPDLAQSVHNLSNRLSDAGDHPAALGAVREAVEIHRHLAEENPARFNPDFAQSLNNLSVHLSNAGDQPAALATIREAVDLYRRLAAENPARFNPDLAESLNNLSNRLSDAGDRPAALAAIREAVDLYRRLADENPARFNPDLAESLNNLSVDLGNAGDRPAALAAICEAVDLYRRLAAENPARFAPDLALSLNNLSADLSDAGDHPAALAAIREAVEIRRRLAEENPARFNPDLALSLNNLSVHLNNAGDRPAALAAIREAVDLYRPLAKENPARFAPDLARSLNNLSPDLSDAGDGPAALATIREAVDLYRRLADENPARFNPDLAGSLNNLSLRLRDPGDHPAALAAIREAVDLYHRLASENPARFAPDLERGLRNLAILEAKPKEPAK